MKQWKVVVVDPESDQALVPTTKRKPATAKQQPEAESSRVSALLTKSKVSEALSLPLSLTHTHILPVFYLGFFLWGEAGRKARYISIDLVYY